MAIDDIALWSEVISPSSRLGCHQHLLLADAATTVLGEPWHVDGIGLRAPIPGAGDQGLHPDFGEPRTQGTWRCLAAMWCVTPFTRDSGPLRVIPGSHRRPEPPIDMEHGYATGMGPHPDEVKIIATGRLSDLVQQR